MNIINKHGLDPVTIYETDKVKLMLMREEIAVLEQEDDEDDQQYRERLIQVENTMYSYQIVGWWAGIRTVCIHDSASQLCCVCRLCMCLGKQLIFHVCGGGGGGGWGWEGNHVARVTYPEK